MELSVCKTCKHHICVIGENVLCGYTIDRAERLVQKTQEGGKNVNGCPRDKTETKIKGR